MPTKESKGTGGQAEKPFKAGDVVTLKSSTRSKGGEKPMTVLDVGLATTLVFCRWAHPSGTFIEGAFEQSSLKRCA